MSSAPYRAVPNQFRQDLIARKKLIGCWCSLGSPITTEVMGLAGFDWLLLDGEHAPNDVLSFIPQLMALKDSASAPVVRPQWNDTVIIKRLLDAGFYNFLIPFVESADDAKRAVAATRYPPQGVRGVSVSHRSNRYGTVPEYFEVINDNISVIVQIESRKAVAVIDEICAVEGVDCVFIGPSDLAAGYGYLGNPLHPEVQQAMQKIIASAKEHGKPAGILAPVEADARRYLEMGVTFVAVGSDLGLFRNASQGGADGGLGGFGDLFGGLFWKTGLLNTVAARLAAVPGIRDLSLSTNGTRLAEFAGELRRAGVARLNVSLDSLDRNRVAQIARRDVLPQILDGLEAARGLGFRQIKINMVALPDTSHDEIEAMTEYCIARGFILRLIETMPVGQSGQNAGFIDLRPVMQRMREQFGLIDGVVPGGGPARYLVSPDRKFKIGFITAISQHFCDTCNRIRLAANGTLHLCLGRDEAVDFRQLMRSGRSDAEILAALQAGLAHKPARHDFGNTQHPLIRMMSATGG